MPIVTPARASGACASGAALLSRSASRPTGGSPFGALAERRVGPAVLWRPTPAQEAVLAADFDEIVGRAGAGHVEDLDARAGRWLQLRPKAPHGRARTVAYGPEDERITAVPRGFYLRARFTAALLRDPSALPA
jgi:DNA mismatch repair protein MutH